MRRPLSLAACLLGAAGTLRAQQVVARVGGELTAAAGERVVVPIGVDMTNAAGATLGSYTARLTWDPSVLSLSYEVCCGRQDSTLRGNFAPPSVNADSAYLGILKFAAVSPTGVGGRVTIANLPFYATGSATPSNLSLSFSEMSAAGTFQSLLPILTTQGATFCLARGRWGDLDRDGQANSRDALLILTQVVGLPVDPQLADTSVADVDADGRASSRDALVILSHAVGISVAGQRVLLPAPGSCGTGSPRQLAMLPGAIDLAVSQELKLLIQAIDSAGRSVSVPAATWRSSDYAVAGVESDGKVTGRSAGTATITAEVSPGVSASATVTVAARRPNWYVDVAAIGRAVQNGSQTYPYENPLLAFPWAAEGDTIRVARGGYYWNDDGELNVGVVILGGTPGDTTTRPEFRGVQGYYESGYTGLWLRGGQRTEARNVVFRNFDYAVELDGVRNFVIEDSKIVFSGDYYDYGIYHCGASMDTVRIDRTTILGDSSYRYGTAVYYSGCASPSARLTVFRDSRIQYVEDGLYLYGPDSLAVIRSRISDVTGNGIYSSQEYSETPALYVTRSRLERIGDDAIRAYYQRRVVIDTSVIVSDSSGALRLEGDYYSQLASIHLRGDSVYHSASYYDWLNVDYADSLLVQDVVVLAPANRSVAVTGYVYADVATVRRSRFLNLGDSYSGVFYFSGRRFLADSVTMTGCAVTYCEQSVGFDVNLTSSDGSSTILRSSFSRIGAAVLLGEGVHEVRNLTIDSALTGVYGYNVDSARITDNLVSRLHSGGEYSGVGVYLEYASGSRGPSLVARNNLSCTSGDLNTAGVAAYYHGAIVDQDTVTGCYAGIALYSVSPGTRVRRSTLRTNPTGVYLSQYNDSLLVRVDTTAISGSSNAAVQVDFGRLSMFNSRIENNANGVVIGDYFGWVSQLHSSAFVNNAGWAVSAAYDSVDASGNYWGGGAASTSQPNGVNGRVNAAGHLTGPPTGQPGLAPPPVVASLMAAWPSSGYRPVEAPLKRFGAAAAATAQQPVRPVRESPRYAPGALPGRSAVRVAQIERNRERHEAQVAERERQEGERTARLAARRAEREQNARPR